MLKQRFNYVSMLITGLFSVCWAVPFCLKNGLRGTGCILPL